MSIYVVFRICVPINLAVYRFCAHQFMSHIESVRINLCCVGTESVHINLCCVYINLFCAYRMFSHQFMMRIEAVRINLFCLQNIYAHQFLSAMYRFCAHQFMLHIESCCT